MVLQQDAARRRQAETRHGFVFALLHMMAEFVAAAVKREDQGAVQPLRWSPETGQVGSLTQSQHNDPYVKETTSAQSRSESPGRLGSPEGH